MQLAPSDMNATAYTNLCKKNEKVYKRLRTSKNADERRKEHLHKVRKMIADEYYLLEMWSDTCRANSFKYNLNNNLHKSEMAKQSLLYMATNIGRITQARQGPSCDYIPDQQNNFVIDEIHICNSLQNGKITCLATLFTLICITILNRVIS